MLQKSFDTLTHGLVSGHRKIPFLITRFRASEMYLDVEICGFLMKDDIFLSSIFRMAMGFLAAVH